MNPMDKTYAPHEIEQRIYARWERDGCFRITGKGEPYCIVIPPPNVTAALHLGHALNNTLQDVLARRKRMQGFDTLWMPGTDHAGIATQSVVERRLHEEEGLTRHDLGREKLLERIWTWKDEYMERILGQLRRMGASCDWERTNSTMSRKLSRAVRTVFLDFFNEGLIYRGKKLINWSVGVQTALSNDELEHHEVSTFFWDVNYPVAGEQGRFITVATTRPETMLGDTAVGVHPDTAAALEKAEADLTARLESATAKEKPDIQTQVDDVRERRKTMLPLLERLRDMASDGRKVMLPLLNRPIPLVAD